MKLGKTKVKVQLINNLFNGFTIKSFNGFQLN